MCFNYAMLKAEFGLNLETEVISESEELAEDAEPAAPEKQPQQQEQAHRSLFDAPSNEEEMPF